MDRWRVLGRGRALRCLVGVLPKHATARMCDATALQGTAIRPVNVFLGEFAAKDDGDNSVANTGEGSSLSCWGVLNRTPPCKTRGLVCEQCVENVDRGGVHCSHA